MPDRDRKQSTDHDIQDLKTLGQRHRKHRNVVYMSIKVLDTTDNQQSIPLGKHKNKTSNHPLRKRFHQLLRPVLIL